MAGISIDDFPAGWAAVTVGAVDRMTGRLVVVTGAARGQGAAEAAALVAGGAQVIAADVLDDEGTTLAGVLASQGPGTIWYRHLDVSRPEDWQALAGELAAAGRPVHGLVNNAGIAQRPRLGSVGLDEWNRAIAINLTGPMLGIQALVPLMEAGSSIVNVGSVAALTAYHGAAYTASKWGLRGLTRVAALEFGPRGIRTNIIHPGHIDTPLTATASQAFVDASIGLTPLGRAGQPEEVAPLVVFLLSEQAAYINGAEIAVDGGYTSHGGTKSIIDAIDGH